MGYVLSREYPEPVLTGLRYAEEKDTGERNARPFEGSDGRWYSWIHVISDDGEIFDYEGNVVTTYNELRKLGVIKRPAAWRQS